MTRRGRCPTTARDMHAPRVSTLAIALALAPLGCAGPRTATPTGADRVADGRALPSAQATARPAPEALEGLLPRMVVGQARLPVDADTPVAFSHDGGLLALGDSSGLVRLFDAATGAPIEALGRHDLAVSLLVATPEGGLLSGDAAGELVLWAPGPHGWLDATPTTLASRHRAPITAASFSADGATMVSADSDGNALLWAMKEPRVLAQLDESEDSGDGVTVGRGAASHYVVSADGKSVLGWSATSSFVRPLPTGKATRRLRARGRILSASAASTGFSVTRRDKSGAIFSDQIEPSGRLASTALVAPPGSEPLGDSHTLRREARGFAMVAVSADGPVVPIELEAHDEVRVVASRSGRRALLVSDAGTALLDLTRGEVRLQRPKGSDLGWPRSIAAVGQELLVADGSQVHLFDGSTGASRGSLPLAAERLVAAADGRRWAGAGAEAFVVDSGSRELLFESVGGDHSTLSADLTLLARPDDNAIVLLAAEGSGREVARIAFDERYPTILAFSPDSRSLLVADAKGQLDRFDANTGARLASRSTERRFEALVHWGEEAIFATVKPYGRPSLLVRIDPSTLAVTDEMPVGDSVARSSSGAWLAWTTKAGVRVRKADGPVFSLPERGGAAGAVAFDPAERTLYVGRLGTVEVWALDDLEASGAGVAVDNRKPRQPPPQSVVQHDSFGDALPTHARRRFGTTRGALGSEIEDVRVIDDHIWLVGSWGRAILWDRATGAPIRRIESEGTAGDRNTFLTPDERWIVARGVLSLGVWSVATGERTATVERPDGKDGASALSPRGDRFVIGTEQGELRIYQVPSLDLLHSEPRAHKGRIEALAYSPDGKLFASCGRFGVIRLNDAVSGALKRTIVGASTDEYAGCSSAAFSPDGRTLYADLSGMRAFDVATGRSLGEFVGWEGNLSQIAVSPDGKFVALGRHHDPATVWDGRRRTKVATLDTPDGGAAVTFSPNGAELLVGGSDGVLRTFETKSWSEVGARPVHSRIDSFAIVEGGRVLVTADPSGQLRSWDALSGGALGARIVDSYPSLVATDGGLLLRSQGIRPVDPRTLRDSGPLLDVSGGAVAASADGRVAAMADGHRMQLLNLSAGTTQEIEWGSGYVDAVAVDPKGRFVAAGGTNGAVRFFGPSGVELGAGRAREPVQSIEFSPVEDVVFVCARREGAAPAYVALEVPTGKQRWRLDELPFSAGDGLAVSHDGKLLAFADHEGIRLLDSGSGFELGTIPTKAVGGAEVLAFSPDRNTLYVSRAGTVLAWDLGFLR